MGVGTDWQGAVHQLIEQGANKTGLYENNFCVCIVPYWVLGGCIDDSGAAAAAAASAFVVLFSHLIALLSRVNEFLSIRNDMNW